LDLKTTKKRESGKRGLPAKDEKLLTYYSVYAKIKHNKVHFDQKMENAGLFVLESNDLGHFPEEILENYKEQDRVEKGFRFLKILLAYQKSISKIRAEFRLL